MPDQKINEIPEKNTPASSDRLLLVGPAEESLIDYDKLADAILNKLTSKTYSLDQGVKTLIAALNELNSKTYLLQGGTAIPENADMNTYTTPGNYYVTSNAQAATLSNSPFGNNAFILKVEYGNGVTYPRQIFTEYSTGRKAIRFISSSGGSWSDWLYFSDDATVLSNIVFSNAGSHNSIYRGRNLGSSVTTAQWNAISAGTFDDLYIGDYWTIGGVNWRIAAFDYYYNTGDTTFTKHHAVIVPDTALYTHAMNDTNITTGAYVGSKMYTEGLEQAKTTISNAFGSSHVLSHRIYLSNATSNGKASDGAWTDSTVDLMCEHMVYGSGIFSPVSDGSTVPNNYRVEKSQLPLFAHNPRMIGIRSTWWLRDVITSAAFALVINAGLAASDHASNTYGVRPAFCIGV